MTAKDSRYAREVVLFGISSVVEAVQPIHGNRTPASRECLGNSPSDEIVLRVGGKRVPTCRLIREKVSNDAAETRIEVQKIKAEKLNTYFLLLSKAVDTF